MKPFYSFLFIISIFAILIGISSVFPKKGIPMGSDTISFPSITNILFPQNKKDYVDISNIIKNIDTTKITDTIVELTEKKIPKIKDSVITEANKPNTANTIREVNTENLKKHIQYLEFPDNDPSILYSIFNQLNNAQSNKELIRILHYGDSQIEGDRITSYIRNKLQLRVGGSGAGLVPPVQAYNYQTSIRQYASNNWIRHTSFPHLDKSINHRRYGLLASYASFSNPISDSINAVQEAWLRFEPSYLAYRSTRQYTQCRIFLGHIEKPLIVEVFVNDERFDANMVSPSLDLNVLQWNFKEEPKKLAIKFSGTESPEVYAIALDNPSGIAVDNIALRGSSGLIFSKTDQTLFSQLLKTLNVKMIILQFGGNVVPYITNYNYYEKLFYAQLKTIQKALPGIPIIVIGPADMSEKINGSYITHHNLIPITEALKKATFKANCTYWDMFKAMGGKNSMPSWVFANPPLASKDFVHFNIRGARIVAELFYNSFIYEYEKYMKSIANE